MVTRLVLDRVAAGYDGKTTVSDISIEARSGEMLALMGPNGAGKTTLIRLMDRILRPSSGEIMLNGVSLWRLSAVKAARVIARVPQTSNPAWPFTVEEMVELGRFPHQGWLGAFRAGDRSIVERAMEATGVAHLRKRPYAGLSGGEQQRTVIARALAQAPSLLLLDEPVAHLDLAYQLSVLDLLHGLARDGLAVVVSLHDPNQAALYADRIVVLAEGRIAAEGKPRDVLGAELISRIYGTRVATARHPVSGQPVILPVPRWMAAGHLPTADRSY